MNMRSLYDPAIEIPHDVVLAAQKVRHWVESNVPDLRNVIICGVGVRTFLNVKTMMDEHTPTVYFTELRSDEKEPTP
jgi:hypothetical protein